MSLLKLKDTCRATCHDGIVDLILPNFLDPTMGILIKNSSEKSNIPHMPVVPKAVA